eukprot:1968348-Rhodomonas_salina.3
MSGGQGKTALHGASRSATLTLLDNCADPEAADMHVSPPLLLPERGRTREREDDEDKEERGEGRVGRREKVEERGGGEEEGGEGCGSVWWTLARCLRLEQSAATARTWGVLGECLASVVWVGVQGMRDWGGARARQKREEGGGGRRGGGEWGCQRERVGWRERLCVCTGASSSRAKQSTEDLELTACVSRFASRFASLFPLLFLGPLTPLCPFSCSLPLPCSCSGRAGAHGAARRSDGEHD